MAKAEPQWFDCMIDDVAKTIRMGLDHTLSNAPARILLAKNALILMIASMKRRAQILEKLRSDLDAELRRKQIAAQDNREIALCYLRDECPDARCNMYKEQISFYTEQITVWSEARKIVRKAFNKANSE